ncbi:putative secreted protein [Rhizobium phage Paso]|uniref:Putative secreted protein n=1 Tax=Rhizobium phage Paso TaxID=2767574 RepID=A0A7L8G651_9CAUD|nr:putative secreted protein [Rhizobium phage Paso]
MWVLIIIILSGSHGQSQQSVDFNSKEACLKAQDSIIAGIEKGYGARNVLLGCHSKD